ncbi:MAG: hypothetical protein ACPL7R_08930 [Anaerolineae bacterium]
MQQSDSAGNRLKPASWSVWLARRISDVFSPPVLSGSVAVFLTKLATSSWVAALTWSSLYILLADLLPLAYLVRLVRQGKVGDLHVAIRSQRLRPLMVTLVCMALAFAAAVALGAPRPLNVFLGITLVQGVLLTAITVFWQISFHAAAASAMVCAVAVVYGTLAALFLTPILIVVAWARLRLRRHTFRQIVAGAAVSGVLYGPILAYALLQR